MTMPGDDELSRRTLLKAMASAAAVLSAAPRVRAQAPPVSTTRGVRFGIMIPQGAPYDGIIDRWKQTEELGFDTGFVFDHFMPLFPTSKDDCCFEAWTTLAAIAAQTTRLRLGVLVTGNTYRNPALVAKMAATLDHISKGRVILGLGAGWMQREHDAFGIPFDTPGGRARRLVEAVKVIEMLFTQEVSNFDGKYYTLKDAPFRPAPIQKPHPPILIGGMGPKIVQPLAARYAQIWHFGITGNDVEEVRRVCANFDGICRTVGRDPAAVEKATSINAAELGKYSAAEMRRLVKSLVDAGPTHFILLPAFDDQRKELRRFSEEVIPEFRTS